MTSVSSTGNTAADGRDLVIPPTTATMGWAAWERGRLQAPDQPNRHQWHPLHRRGRAPSPPSPRRPGWPRRPHPTLPPVIAARKENAPMWRARMTLTRKAVVSPSLT